jgi:hypothetical protein
MAVVEAAARQVEQVLLEDQVGVGAVAIVEAQETHLAHLLLKATTEEREAAAVAVVAAEALLLLA